MYINTIKSTLRNVWGRPVQVVSEVGKYRDYNFVIRKEIENGLVQEKQFVFWDDRTQKIINKVRNKDGKFDRLG